MNSKKRKISEKKTTHNKKIRSSVLPSTSSNVKIHEKNDLKAQKKVKVSKKRKISDQNQTTTIKKLRSSILPSTSSNTKTEEQRDVKLTQQTDSHKKKVQTINNNITLIANLNPYQTSWSIKVRVITKRSIHTWTNLKGSGKLFNIDIMDSSAEIRAIAFYHLVDRFYDKIEENKIYEISNGDLKIANKQYTNLKNNFEIIFNDDTTIREIDNADENIPRMKWKLTPLSNISKIEKNTIINVIGICKEVKVLEEFTSKSTGRELRKKELLLIDANNNGK